MRGTGSSGRPEGCRDALDQASRGAVTALFVWLDSEWRCGRIEMRKRSYLLIFVSLLLWGGCIDTAEPTGPVPAPPPDDGGELAPAEIQGADGSKAARALPPR
jgi:hypothetical protein